MGDGERLVSIGKLEHKLRKFGSECQFEGMLQAFIGLCQGLPISDLIPTYGLLDLEFFKIEDRKRRGGRKR